MVLSRRAKEADRGLGLLAANGHRLPLTDLVIAAIALRHDLFVYTVDPHFDHFPDLKRFTRV